MPLITTMASASAKGYGFGLESSVDEPASVTGLSASALVGNAIVSGINNQTVSVTGLVASGLVSSVSVVIPKPVPANQYWTLISRDQQTGVSAVNVSVRANLFSFTSNPSPSITAIQQDVAFTTLFSSGSALGVINIQTTTSGRVYVSTAYNDNVTPIVSTRVYTFDVSAGTIGSITSFAAVSYSSGSSTVNFAQIEDLSVNPSRTRLGYVYRYQNQSAQTRYQTVVRNIDIDGVTSTLVSPINPIAVNTYDQRVIAINPVADNIIAIGGNLLTNSNTGYVWLYKNWGVSLQETVNNYGVVGRVTSLQWSHSGEYLFANTASSVILVWKVNFNTGVLTQLFSQVQTSGIRGIWTVGDETVILGSSNNALIRTGDNFTFVSGPGGVEINARPALNYNGQYLFAAAGLVKVFEYDGPSLFVTPVINVNNGGRLYVANGSFPMFDGLE